MEVREYCIKNDLSFHDYFKILDEDVTEDVITKVEKVKKPKRVYPKGIVLSILDEVISSGKKEQITLDDLVRKVNREFKSIGYELAKNCPVKGFVSRVLYDKATEIKFKGENRIKKYYRQLEDPVTEKDISKLLKLPLDLISRKHITGKLGKEYLLKNYPINNFSLSDRKNRAFDIEGWSSWDNPDKRNVRTSLQQIIKDHLIDDVLEERSKLTQTIDVAEEALTDIGNVKKNRKIIAYSLKCAETGIYLDLKDRFLYRFIPQDENPHAEKNEFIIPFFNRRDRRNFDAEFKKYLRSKNKQVKRRIKKEIIYEDFDDLDPVGELAEAAKLLSEKLLEEFDEGLEFNYLGLEGPGFGSYLKIFDAFHSNDLKLKAYIPEYRLREFNIMKSIVDAHNGNDLFSEVNLVRESIDDIILLDFVRDPRFKIQSDSRNRSERVIFESEDYPRISIRTKVYYNLLDDLDNGSSNDELKDKYRKFEINDDFIKSLRNRYMGKFDVVFLDYYGGESKKRNRILDRLMTRLKDRAVLAVTTNTSGNRYNLINPKTQKKYTREELVEYQQEQMVERCINEGYDLDLNNIINFEYDTVFTGGKGKEGKKMHFAAYKLLRDWGLKWLKK